MSGTVRHRFEQIEAKLKALEAGMTALEDNLYRIATAANDAVVRDRERIHALEVKVHGSAQGPRR